jgi:DNA-3-methyladenine glycosylase II
MAETILFSQNSDVSVWIELVHAFAATNKDMTKWVFKYLPQPLVAKRKDNLKHLCYTITYQAISSVVCNKIWKQFDDLMKSLGFSTVWPPEIVASLTDEQLRKVQLSSRKVEAIRNVACYLATHTIDETKSSETIAKELMTIKGVGEFTANFFLFENLGRLDIKMHSDLVARKGLQKIHKLEKVPSVKECEHLVKNWGPLASIGSMVCYNVAHLENS